MGSMYVVTWCRIARNGAVSSGSSKHKSLLAASTKAERMALRGALVTVEEVTIDE